MLFFFFKDAATTEIYTLSLHDALPISRPPRSGRRPRASSAAPRRTRRRSATGSESPGRRPRPWSARHPGGRSEEHTSELQSQFHLVCRLLLEKKKPKTLQHTTT